jgi:hypothetical protein
MYCFSLDGHSLLAASGNACKLALHNSIFFISYQNLHVIVKCATPEMFCNYKLALQIYKTKNQKLSEDNWIQLNFDQQLSSRQTLFKINRNNNLPVGLNVLANRFFYLNDK